MKRFLSIVLALLMVVTPTVWAAPTMQTVESAQETVAEVVAAEDAALSGAVTTKPGLNMLTGTTALLNAESDNASFADITNVMSANNFNSTTYAVVDNPVIVASNPSSKVYTATAPIIEIPDSYAYFHPSIKINFDPKFEDERPIYTSFKVAKINNGEHTSNSSSWILTDESQGIVKSFSVSTNAGRTVIDDVYDYSNSANPAVNDGYLNYISFQLTSVDANVSPTTFYFDDIGLYPSYKVTYMDSTGANELYSEYVLLDENKNIMTSIDVTSEVFDSVYYESWSDTIGGDAIESYTLANEDVVLYATGAGVDVVLNGFTTDKSELSYVGETTTLTVDFEGNLDVDYSDVKWSVEGDAVKLSAMSGKTVTATANAYGNATVTVTFDGMSKSIPLNVVDAFDIVSDSTYVTGDADATITLTYKNDYNSPVTWSKVDEGNVATLTVNGDNTATLACAGGSGLVAVTATLDSNTAKTKTIYLYVTEQVIAGDDATTVVAGTASTTVIAEDAGSANIIAKSYTKGVAAPYDVVYTVNDNSLAKLINNADGSATVEAIKNGTLVVTATSVYDNNAVAEFTIEISNQREKFAKYEFRYLALGNSFLNHGEYSGWTWDDPENGARGMAASKVELDYFNRTKYHLTHNPGYVADIDAVKFGGANWEQSLVADLVTDIVNDTALTDEQKESKIIAKATETAKTGTNFVSSLTEKLKTYKPNILTIQLAENVRCMNATALEAAYDVLYGTIAKNKPEDCIVVVITMFSNDVRTQVPVKVAKKYGFLVNDMSFVSTWHTSQTPAVTSYENPYYAYEQYKDSPTVGKFGSHPGDYGHNAIAEGNVKQINSVLASKIESEFIYLPSDLTINGADTITDVNGSELYTVNSDPSDAATEVEWSVDNPNIAYISNEGVLTAVNNGQVVLTATSTYDKSVVATKTVTVSGQAPCFTVSYTAGTDDTSVAGLPESFEYAKDEFVLSSAVPTRNGYKFAGWSLKKDGPVIKTAVIEEDTTIYATWEYAYKWTFDTDGDTESLGYAGVFHAKAANGIFSGMSFETGLSVYFDHLLLDSSLYTDFRFKMLVGSTESNQKLNITVNTTDGDAKFTADITDAEMHEYTFSLKDITGTITGFEIAPSPLNATIEIDEIEFVRVPGADYLNISEENTVIDANNIVYLVGTLNIADGASVILKNGIFVIDDITGNKAITLEDANLITEADIEGYAVIDLGEKASADNTRYVQANGLTYAVNERENKLGLIFDKETIVTITEKNADAFVSSTYYCINNGVVSVIDTFTNALTSKPSAQMRIDEHTGIRFRAGITHTAKNATGKYNVVEYGYVVARADQLEETGSQLNFDFSNVASGTAYLKNDGGVVTKNYVYEMLDDETIFTGVLTNIPKQYYTAVLTARPYMKVKTENGIHIIYGDVISRSIYQVARAILADENNGLSEEELTIIRDIVNSVQPDNETFVDIGGLW